jgi:beta-galactosidase
LADLTKYRLVLVPALYLVSDEAAANLVSYVASGGTAVVGPFSGVVDERDHVRLGGYLGAWRDLLGVRVQEHFPLRAGSTVALSDGSYGRLWTELATVDDAEVLVTYADGPLASGPALTRRRHGDGVAYYLTTQPVEADLRALLPRLAADAGIAPVVAAPAGVEAVRRRHADGRTYTFLANDGTSPVEVEVDGSRVTVSPGGFAVVRHA